MDLGIVYTGLYGDEKEKRGKNIYMIFTFIKDNLLLWMPDISVLAARELLFIISCTI